MRRRFAAILLCILLCCMLPATAMAGGDWTEGEDYEYESDTMTLTIYNSAVLQDMDFMNNPAIKGVDKDLYSATKKLVLGQDVTSIEDASLESFLWMKTEMIVFMSASTQIRHNMTEPPEEYHMPKDTLVHGFAGSGAETWAGTMGLSFSAHAFGSWLQITADNLNLPDLGEYGDEVDLSEEQAAIHYRQCTICLEYEAAQHNFKQDPGSGQMVCGDCGFTQSTENWNLIDASKTVSLSPGVPFTFGAGTYQVSGDPTVYNGDQNFYVQAEGQYTITRR